MLTRTRRIAIAGIAILTGSAATLTSTPLAAAPFVAQDAAPFASTQAERNPFAKFVPSDTPVQHTISYNIWDYALRQVVVWMGPSQRKRPLVLGGSLGSRIRAGHNSLYRVEGSMVFFSRFDRKAIDSFGDYRRELEQVANTLDIAALPRNEQLAFWFNLHNVAMVEKIAENWPIRQPRTLQIDGVPLNDAPFLIIRGVAMSLRDIRERIVYPNWRDPKVIYGFWLGEIGSPSLERAAFTGPNVSSLLDIKAADYINSLRGTQKRGKTLYISSLYDEVRPFYFPDFEADIRNHMRTYASEDVAKLIAKTSATNPSLNEWDIADLSGGRRDSIALKNARPTLSAGALEVLQQRFRKFRRLEKEKIPTGRVYFSDIILPGNDPNKGKVE